MFQRSSEHGQLLSPTARAEFMLVRSAMAAAAGQGKSPSCSVQASGAGLSAPRCHSLLSYWTTLSATVECQPLNPYTWPTLTPLLKPDRSGRHGYRNDYRAW